MWLLKKLIRNKMLVKHGLICHTYTITVNFTSSITAIPLFEKGKRVSKKFFLQLQTKLDFNKKK